MTSLKLVEVRRLDEGVRVTNKDLPISGIDCRAHFVNEDLRKTVLDEVASREYVWEGFHQRRRVQRYELSEESDVPPSLRLVARRLVETNGKKASYVSIEEYGRLKWKKSGDYASQWAVTTFESNTVANDSSCFVALLPLNKTAYIHMNRPLKRDAQCWRLESERHQSDLYLEAGSLLVKLDDALWNWRSLISAEETDDSPVVVVKFYNLPTESSNIKNEDTFGYIPRPEDAIPRGDMPALSEILTVIVTTSPIRSHPSTEVLERTFSTFHHAGPVFHKCRKVIICDGVRKIENGASTKHVNIKQAMRNGIVNDDQESRYREFKDRLRAICAKASLDSPFFNTTVEELNERQGYGFALRHALRNCVSTKYVCVIQHDRTFMRTTPMNEAMETMWQSPAVKYIGFSQRSNLYMRDSFLAKYGKVYIDDYDRCILRPTELCVDASSYGPESASTATWQASTPKLRKWVDSVVEGYLKSYQGKAHDSYVRDNPPADGKHQMSLSPTLFWYDNTHIVETAHYRDFIFNEYYRMVARGGFVEDKCSPVITKTVERLGFVEGHSRFGCFILDDHSGMPFIGHLDGGSYLTDEEKASYRK